jgi:hypothetical protein
MGREKKYDRDTVEWAACSGLVFISVLFLILAWTLPIKECSASYDPCLNGYSCNVGTGMCNCYASNFSYTPSYRPYLCDEHAIPPVPWLIWVGFAFLLLTLPVNAAIHFWWTKEEKSDPLLPVSQTSFDEIQHRLHDVEKRLLTVESITKKNSKNG